MFVPREKQASTAGVCRSPTQCEEVVVETSNQVRHRLRSSWEDWAPHRSQVAVPAVLPRRRRRLLRNGPANRFACSTVASRLESKGPSGTITNLHQRPRFPVHARKIHMQTRSGLAAWQQLVVAAYIEKHIAEYITVHALARFVYLTSHCFSRAFKRSFGIPPHRYVIQHRIERGKTLLAGSAWSIAEIALALGFTRTSSFSAAFRKITGISPTEYRLTQQ
jgi:AraC-like DNA-binding protein